MTRPIHLVTATEGLTQHAIAVCTDADEFPLLCQRLRHEGYVVLNQEQSVTSDEIGLAYYLPRLVNADVLAITTDWWSSLVGNQLMQISGWLGLGFVDETGCPLPTVTGRVS